MLRKILILISVVVAVATISPALTASAAVAPDPAAKNCRASFLGFPAWYDGITNSDCSLMSPQQLGGDPNTQISRYISIITLNIIQIMLMLVAYVSVAFIMYGGFKYLTSAGDSNGVSGGKKTILNAIIGLVISFMSIAIVNLIAGNIK